MAKGRWCNYPRRCVPAPGEVGVGFKATCLCGKRVSVTVRGLFWRHKQPAGPEQSRPQPHTRQEQK